MSIHIVENQRWRDVHAFFRRYENIRRAKRYAYLVDIYFDRPSAEDAKVAVMSPSDRKGLPRVYEQMSQGFEEAWACSSSLKRVSAIEPPHGKQATLAWTEVFAYTEICVVGHWGVYS